MNAVAKEISSTPRTDALMREIYRVDDLILAHPTAAALNTLCRAFERENATLRAALEGVLFGWDNWAEKGLIERHIEKARAALKVTP